MCAAAHLSPAVSASILWIRDKKWNTHITVAREIIFMEEIL